MGCAAFRRAKYGMNIVVRTFHTLLILVVAANLVYLKTALHEAIWTGDWLYYISFFALLIFSLVMYFSACLTDPGFVPLRKKVALRRAWDNSDEDIDDEDAAMLRESMESESKVKLRRCGFCGIEQPLRTRHCEDCGRCVRKFDHHCPWLETCVGEQNHRYFWMFLGSTEALIVWGIIIVWPCFVYNKAWIPWFKLNGAFIFDMLVMSVGGVMVLILLCCHTYVMITGMTSWELISRDRITYLRGLSDGLNPFHEGYFGNIKNFLCAMRIRKWDLIYYKNVCSEYTV